MPDGATCLCSSGNIKIKYHPQSGWYYEGPWKGPLRLFPILFKPIIQPKMKANSKSH